VAFDVLSQFLVGLRDPPRGEQINYSTVDLDAHKPFHSIHTITDSLEEHVQQIAQVQQRLQHAFLEAGAVKLDVEFDLGLQIARVSKSFRRHAKFCFNRGRLLQFHKILNLSEWVDRLHLFAFCHRLTG
jgi:hypothetical protein